MENENWEEMKKNRGMNLCKNTGRNSEGFKKILRMK